MSRIDVVETEAEFIDFRFADEEAAIKAEKLFPSDFVRTEQGVVCYRANILVEGIREKLEASGLEWTEAESSLTEEDMWPEWPEDCESSVSMVP